VTGTRHDPADTRDEILELVSRYYRERHALPPFDPDRDPVRCAGRVFGEEELGYLVEPRLDFCLTLSRFTQEFDERAAELLVVPLITADRWCLRWRSQLTCDGGPDEAARQDEADHLCGFC
jgi:hypothetical protein